MKNNTYYIKIFFTLLSFIFLANNTFAKEINIKAKEVLTFEKGNVIIGKEEVEAKINNEIEIYADKITYNKISDELTAEGNVTSKDLKNSIEIKSQKVIYKKKENKIFSVGNTFFNINTNYDGQSSDVNFLINEDIIYSKNLSNFSDNLDNLIESSSFRYSNKTEILRANNIKFIDNKKNKYFLKNGFLKVKENILLG